MICYIRVGLPEEKHEAIAKSAKAKILFEEMTGVPCLVRWFEDSSLSELSLLPLRAVIIGGFAADIQDIGTEPFSPLAAFVYSTNIPVLGICGGHQLIGCMFGGDPWMCIPMRRLEPGEPDISDYRPGWFKESGYYPVRKTVDDPLFENLPDEMTLHEVHSCEVKTVPPEFDVIATSDTCRVQAMKHKEKPVYGTQFHPEVFNEHYPHGRVVLENFFRLAGLPVQG